MERAQMLNGWLWRKLNNTFFSENNDDDVH